MIVETVLCGKAKEVKSSRGCQASVLEDSVGPFIPAWDIFVCLQFGEELN
jgi:hypothetical protein